MASQTDSEDDPDPRFIHPQGVGWPEDVENYRLGGFHPVHLNDELDFGRYRIMHKLGHGGYSTVWIARDSAVDKWVALKIVDAKHSAVTNKANAALEIALRHYDAQYLVTEYRHFWFEGLNGRHLCVVLPILGPSTAELSNGLQCRLRPGPARKLSFQAASAVAELHSRGICHGDITTGNLVLGIPDLDDVEEDELYQLFGKPHTGLLETESGEHTGPEAPRYIVKSIDFLALPHNFIEPEIHLIDFDQSFPVAAPPKKMLGTPISFLAPEVAVGQAPSFASDIWALGCCILRLRSGEEPFSSPFDVNTPEDLIRFIAHTLGDIPESWRQKLLWDSEGRPTKDTEDSVPHDQWWEGEPRSLRNMIYNIWDEPEGGSVETGVVRTERGSRKRDHIPLPPHFSKLAWNPMAVKIDNVYITGYGEPLDELLPVLPKISAEEADLLYNLLSRIFVYEPADRPTAKEILEHPWFQYLEADKSKSEPA